MSTHSNEGDTSHIIPDWEQACKKAEGKLKGLQEDSEYYFDHMMRYMMFIRDNGHTQAYLEYAKERCYDRKNPHATPRSAPE